MKGVRYVLSNAADRIAESVALSLAERGLDDTAFNLIVIRGGPVRKYHLRAACPGDRRVYDRAVKRLLDLEKLVDIDGALVDHPRAEAALERARKRLTTNPENPPEPDATRTQVERKSDTTRTQNERKSESVSSQRNDLDRPSRAPTSQDGETSSRKKVLKPVEVESRRSAPARKGAQDPPPPPSEEDKAAVAVEIVKCAVEASVGAVPKGLRDPAAYQAKIDAIKFRNVLDVVSVYTGKNLPADARLPAWELIAVAQSAGSWEAMPPDERNHLRRLRKLAAFTKCVAEPVDASVCHQAAESSVERRPSIPGRAGKLGDVYRAAAKAVAAQQARLAEAAD